MAYPRLSKRSKRSRRQESGRPANRSGIHDVHTVEEKVMSVDRPVDQLRFNKTWDIGVLPSGRPSCRPQ